MVLLLTLKLLRGTRTAPREDLHDRSGLVRVARASRNRLTSRVCLSRFAQGCGLDSPHNPKVAGSNPAPATNRCSTNQGLTATRRRPLMLCGAGLCPNCARPPSVLGLCCLDPTPGNRWGRVPTVIGRDLFRHQNTFRKMEHAQKMERSNLVALHVVGRDRSTRP